MVLLQGAKLAEERMPASAEASTPTPARRCQWRAETLPTTHLSPPGQVAASHATLPCRNRPEAERPRWLRTHQSSEPPPFPTPSFPLPSFATAATCVGGAGVGDVAAVNIPAAPRRRTTGTATKRRDLILLRNCGAEKRAAISAHFLAAAPLRPRRDAHGLQRQHQRVHGDAHASALHLPPWPP